MGLFTAEIRKFWTVTTTWVLTLAGLGLIVLSASFTVFASDLAGPFTGSAEQVAATIDQIGGTAIIVLVVAILSMTTEFRHGTVGRTLQITPSRTRVLLAKLAAGVAYGLAFFVAGLVVVAILLGIGAAVNDTSLAFGDPVWSALWQGPVGLGLNAIFGVALGALIRSQVVAITLALIWLFVVENTVNAFWPEIARWLPFQALNALFLSDEVMAGAPEGMFNPLEPGIALVTFLGYVVVAAIGATVLMRTRDV